METPDTGLLSPSFWEGDEVDLRLNPQVPFDRTGLAEVFDHEPMLRGQVLFLTSGSSGSPELVCLSRKALLGSAKAVNHHLAVGAEDRWLCPLPTFHVGGFGIWARGFAAGASVSAFEGRWEPERFHRVCHTHSISLTSLVATQVFDLVQARLEAPATLRVVIVGGSALTADLGQRARELGWPVLQSFGMTETGSQVATQRIDDLKALFQNADLPILPIWEARTTETGMLELRGEALFSGYLRRENATWRFERPFDAEGWFTTADQVRLDSGTLTPLGRGGRTVKILGELVNLDRLEGIIHEIAGSGAPSVALETRTDPRAERRLILVAEKSLSEARVQEIREAFDRTVAPFEQIQETVWLTAFPRSELGKIRREALANLLNGL